MIPKSVQKLVQGFGKQHLSLTRAHHRQILLAAISLNTVIHRGTQKSQSLIMFGDPFLHRHIKIKFSRISGMKLKRVNPRDSLLPDEIKRNKSYVRIEHSQFAIFLIKLMTNYQQIMQKYFSLNQRELVMALLCGLQQMKDQHQKMEANERQRQTKHKSMVVHPHNHPIYFNLLDAQNIAWALNLYSFNSHNPDAKQADLFARVINRAIREDLIVVMVHKMVDLVAKAVKVEHHDLVKFMPNSELPEFKVMQRKLIKCSKSNPQLPRNDQRQLAQAQKQVLQGKIQSAIDSLLKGSRYNSLTHELSADTLLSDFTLQVINELDFSDKYGSGNIFIIQTVLLGLNYDIKHNQVVNSAAAKRSLRIVKRYRRHGVKYLTCEFQSNGGLLDAHPVNKEECRRLIKVIRWLIKKYQKAI